uniref:Heat shock protein (HSP-70 cofactor) n=1 Tax=mine drainage metagenome TaxID=410659 RepID=E6QIP4_9ZZZZ
MEMMTEQEQEFGVSAAEAVTDEGGQQEQGANPAEMAEENTGAEQALVEQIARLETERDQLMDRLARLQAEFDNARKRQEREKTEFRDYATGMVVEQFLPVLDNFTLALGSNASAEQLRSGVELIVKQMDEVLRGLNVQAVATVGEMFDPRVHEALGSVERDDLPDQSVAEEIRRGYRLRERLLRPALVRVASNPGQTEA